MATASPEEFSVGRLATEATERAVRQLARGCSFEGLSYEIAFRAVVAGGVDRGWIDPFARVAATELAESIDALPDAAAAAAARARAAHEREWPHDCPGAELAAKLAAVQEAEQLLAEAYARILDELTPAVRERAARASSSWWECLRGRGRDEQYATGREPLMPLEGRREQYGWPQPG